MARALLPSWRFFDDVDPAPRLFYRVAKADAALSAWLPLSLQPARGGASLAFNPQGNLALAQHALLEQLLGDVAEPDVSDASAVEGLTSYALVTQLVRVRLRALTQPPAVLARFQFKITLAESFADPSAAAQDVLVSRIHEV